MNKGKLIIGKLYNVEELENMGFIQLYGSCVLGNGFDTKFIIHNDI